MTRRRGMPLHAPSLVRRCRSAWAVHLKPRGSGAVRHLRAGGAGRLWNRIFAIDLFGHSFQLAALAMMCFFPFLIVVTAAAGRDAAVVLSGWLGLNQRAAQAVASLFSPGQGTGALTVTSVLLLVLGAVATAGVLQSWYQEVFAVPGRGWRDVTAQLHWLASLVAYGVAQAVLGHGLGEAPGGPLLQGLLGLAVATLFWWWSMYVLLAGAVGWRTLVPAAVATGVCWTGLGVFSSLYFSSAIVANEQEYGSIGVVMIILSWLVAVGVVIHLGAIVGRLYLERRTRPSPTSGRPGPGPDRPNG